MNKKIYKSLIITICSILLLSSISFANSSINLALRIDGSPVYSPGSPPFIQNGTTFVPIRLITELLGYQVDWNTSTRTATFTKGSSKIETTVGNSEAKVNGKSIAMPQAAALVNGTTYVPLRFISEAAGYDVKYTPFVEKNSQVRGLIDIYTEKSGTYESLEKAHQFIEVYANENGYDLLQYLLYDINGNSYADYIALMGTNPDSFDGYIIVIDGKTREVINSHPVMIGWEYTMLTLNQKSNAVDINYNIFDGLATEYNFRYDKTGTSLDPYQGLFSNGKFNITKDNLEQLFSISSIEAVRFHGSPDIGYEYGDYAYDSFVYNFRDGNSKHPEGASSIRFYKGDDIIFGTQVGMRTKEIENILGAPFNEYLFEEGDGGYNMIYHINGHQIHFVAYNDVIHEILIKCSIDTPAFF